MAKVWSEECKTIKVCIDSYQNGTLQGRIYNPILDARQSFSSMIDFILKIEQILENTEFPKAYTVTRTFSPPNKKPPDTSGISYRDGQLATFSLRILFRQNASWQGSIQWLDRNQEQSFRSVLELILLFDNALTSKQAS